MRRIFTAIGFASMLVLAASCNGGSSKTAEPAAEVEAAAPSVTVVTAGKRDVLQKGVYNSNVEANVVNNIAPQQALRIKKTYVEVGDFVSAGQKLADMDVVNLQQSRLQLLNDSTEFVRLKSLYEAGGISKSDFESFELAYNVHKTSYKNLLENTELRSPVSGVVSARNYDQGDMYSMGKPLFTVEQITPVKLRVAISEKDYTKVKQGDKVEIVADALPGESFTGTVSRIYPTLDAATHTFTAEVKVVNSGRRLRPGMYTKVTVTFGTNNSIVIPDKAVVRQQGSGDKYVYVLNSDGTVTFTKILLGTRLYSEYEVLEGLEDGAKVVTEGQLRIKDGIKVEAKEE
ncbi:MAG: efflux RND transporter periplasmic adaptor subunit [Bacteroidales bacterium]|nr:efflux RND transporter periplasmic adaptor subunit [Bacteroidales bacterium]